jgi:hypothetical protein
MRTPSLEIEAVLGGSDAPRLSAAAALREEGQRGDSALIRATHSRSEILGLGRNVKSTSLEGTWGCAR